MTNPLTVVYAREPIPASGPSVFLAGPTPRASDVASWRPAAIEELAARWRGEQPLTVLTPESRGGVRAKHYDDQVGWETEARAAADAILFWIPRDLETLPGFTTNVEFGLDIATGKVVLGCPSNCPNPERNRYLVYVAQRHGAPVRDTLAATVDAALDIVTTRALVPETFRVTADVVAMTPDGQVLLIERDWPPYAGEHMITVGRCPKTPPGGRRGDANLIVAIYSNRGWTLSANADGATVLNIAAPATTTGAAEVAALVRSVAHGDLVGNPLRR